MLRCGLLLFLLLYTPILAQDPSDPQDPPKIEDIVNKIDRLFRSDSSEAQMEMTIVTPDWTRTMQLDAWTRGMEDTFILIKSPKKDRGVATLRKGDEMWNYYPKVDKVIKVPPSMMMGSWMGSDFTNDDLVHETSLLDDYSSAFVEDEEIPEGHVVISLKPKEQTVTVWEEIRLLVRLEDTMPLEQTYFDERGNKVRVLKLNEIKEMGGKTIPTTLEMVSLTKENHKTVVRYKEAKFDHGVPSDTFSLRNLKKKR